MSNLPDFTQNNEQILNDIQSLQQIEQQLFTSLETNVNLTTTEQKEIVDKINQISNMRINLYQTLDGVNSFYKNALHSSVDTLKEQTQAIQIVETELNRTKQRMKLLETEKENKIRLIEINNYFSDKYAEHVLLMKILIMMTIPILILSILKSKGLLDFLPNIVYYGVIVIILFIGIYYFINRYISIIMRDNMNYQEYNWFFNPNTAPTNGTSSASSILNPWQTTATSVGTCVGSICCSTGQIYDTTVNKCVINPNAINSTEGFVNNILTKTQIGKYKTDYNLENVKPTISESFIYGKK